MNAWGLGPGIYPKTQAPQPQAQPHCLCDLSPIIDLIRPNPKFNPNAERAFLESLPAKEARAVAGSFAKLERAKAGESLEAIYNEGKDELYRWKRVGEMMETPQIKAARLSTNAIDAALVEEEKLTIPTRLRPVSQAFNFPDEPEYQPIRRALEAIDAAHDDGQLPTIDVQLVREMEDAAEYAVDNRGKPSIAVAARHPAREFSLVHENGHFLDHQAFSPGVFESDQQKSAMARILEAIWQSKAYQEWETIPLDDARDYLLDPTEMWARAYATWVTRRSGSQRLAAQLAVIDQDELGYWQDADFATIEFEISRLFAARGWL